MRKYNFIRQFATILLGSLFYVQMYGQNTTEFLFTETAPEYVRKTMQINAQSLFSEINSAYDQKKPALSISNYVTESAKQRIRSLWETSHFYWRCQ